MLGRVAAPFRFWDPTRPIYTHHRHLPGSRLTDCHVRDSIVTDGCFLDRCDIDESVVGIRTHIEAGAKVTPLGASRRGLLRGRRRRPTACRALGIGRDVVLDRTIIDKNARIGDGARLVNEAQRRPRRW